MTSFIRSEYKTLKKSTLFIEFPLPVEKSKDQKKYRLPVCFVLCKLLMKKITDVVIYRKKIHGLWHRYKKFGSKKCFFYLSMVFFVIFYFYLFYNCLIVLCDKIQCVIFRIHSLFGLTMSFLLVLHTSISDAQPF